MNFDAVKNTLIEEAKKAGLSEYEVYFMESEGISTETLKGEISSFSSEVSGGVCFRCIVNGKMGRAATELFEEQEMKALVKRAINNAKFIEKDDKAVIYAGAEQYASPKLPPIPQESAAILKSRSLELLEKTREQSEYITDGSQTGATRSRIRIELINSHGLCLSNEVGASLSFVQSVVEKDGESQYGIAIAKGIDGEEVDGMPKKATEEALAKIGAAEIESGKYDVIISGEQMRSLLSTFCGVFSGREANLGLSLLKGKEGEQIASACVTLVDDPLYEGSPMQTGFDGEGVATYTKNVIEDGVLKTLLYDIASADKVGRESTGNGQRGGYTSDVVIAPYHFYIKGGALSEDELLSKMKDGIYITELKGLHAGANAVTGDFSIESFGFRVRDGKKCEAVRSFTIAGNFFELLKSIEDISDKVKFSIATSFTVFGSPDVLIRNMSIAGT
jgi:PmbA protein